MKTESLTDGLFYRQAASNDLLDVLILMYHHVGLDNEIARIFVLVKCNWWAILIYRYHLSLLILMMLIILLEY